MKHYHDKGLLGWLDGGLAPPPSPQIVLSKQTGPQQGDMEPCCLHRRTWDSVNSNYYFRYNQSYFKQACVPLPFVIAIGNLQFNKTLHSVTCINCQCCVTPVQFNHGAYNWEQIKFHLHDNASLNVQLLQKEIFETFSKRLPSSTNLKTFCWTARCPGETHEDGFKVL